MRGFFSTNGELFARVRSALAKIAAPLAPVTAPLARIHVALLALIWFGAALATTLWIWGLNPLVFQGDEAVNRLAVDVIQKLGRPIIDLPVQDPEDLLHMHEWITINGRQAVPIYPPVLFYLYGYLFKLGVIGQFVIVALPGTAVAAFFFGTAQLLPPPRRWLAIFAPLLGMPATYWLMRPWQHVSLMLICLCWAFCWWAIWRERKRTGYLAAALFAVGAAASIRPDYAAHLLTAAVLFSLAAEPKRYRAIVGLSVAAGVCAVGANLLLNHAVSGTHYRPVYETLLDRADGVDSTGPFGLLRRLWFPLGIPSASDTLHLVHKYWIEMGQLKWLLFAQVALIPMFFGISWQARALWALGLVVMLLVLISHTDPGSFGADQPETFVHHSPPRYWTPLYLFAALPPLLFLGRTRFRSVVALGAVLAGLLSWSTLNDVFANQTTAFVELHRLVGGGPALLDHLAGTIPNDAVVYSTSRHGTLWSRFRMGLIDETRIAATAASMNRCVDAGLPVYLYTVRANVIRRSLGQELAKHRLKILEVSRSGLHIYRVARR